MKCIHQKAFVIIEPLNIKMRRLIAKKRGTSDKKVEEFDKMCEKVSNASHGRISFNSESGNK